MSAPAFTPPRGTLEIICELVQFEMKVPDGIVLVYNQKRKLPPAKGFFVNVSFLGGRPFGAKSAQIPDPTTGELVEEVSVNQQEMVQIDIFSYDDSARTRNPEIVFAMNSVNAQQVMEKNSIKIARLPSSFVDVSEVQASKRLNRYALAFNLTRAYSRKTVVPSFNEFQNPPKGILVNP